MNTYLNDDSKSRYEERLQEAEAERLASRVSAAQGNAPKSLRVRLGERLIALGQSLKAPAQPATQLD